METKEASLLPQAAKVLKDYIAAIMTRSHHTARSPTTETGMSGEGQRPSARNISGKVLPTVLDISQIIQPAKKSKCSISRLIPLASKELSISSDSKKKSAFDLLLSLSGNGSMAIATIRPTPPNVSRKGPDDMRRDLTFQSTSDGLWDEGIRLEDCKRLSSKVIGIASGLCPVSQAGLGRDGKVFHWKWSSCGGTQITEVHSIHSNARINSIESLKKHKILMSTSAGLVVGYDLSNMCLAFSWPTSERIVHLQKTPNPDLVLSTCVRRDYDQFRIFDISGKSGPVSRSVINFGWLNNSYSSSESSLSALTEPVVSFFGRGCFNPRRKYLFAHGSEDGKVRVWDLRMARDCILNVKVGDEPCGDVIWNIDQDTLGGKEEGEKESQVGKDRLYVSSRYGIRAVDFGFHTV
ncbi:hypothetical protein IE53DRAFT_408490 [Violaceomyces palustris]|uniref:Uncharacterized protein n=1 Tax=Violaceomyces palustris TaxID=1673888 RepID=A0ACD0P6L6_9BASI|nr:hypothetical protein IE53DRAFT_408490 [Violaceomyces palustris]